MRHTIRGMMKKRLSMLLAVAFVVGAVMSPSSALAAGETESTADIRPVGPGQYFADTMTFEIRETDVSAGVIGRKHSVAAVDGGLAQPKSVPDSRTDLSVFGPGWHAEFLGGTTGRKLEIQSGAILVTDLESGDTNRYELRDSVAFPGGGGVQRYEAEDGSKISETTRWDSAAGAMRTTISETIPMDPGPTEDGDDGFTNGSGDPISSADLSLRYSWEQVGTAQGDTWRVTGVGAKAYGTSSVRYDSQGRVATVTEPAAGDQPESVLTFHYAASTTATATAFGDYSGQLKEITLKSGSESPETVARYGYDASGLLRTMADPREDASQQATYTYDATGRLNSINSRVYGAWELTFTGDSPAPAATSTSSTPDSSSGTPPLTGASGINDQNATGSLPGDFPNGGIAGTLAYPAYCYDAVHWLWYTRSGCAAWAAHYGWHYPDWKPLPTGRRVFGINHDHCTKASDRPSRFRFDFRSACDMHDYGYGLIGNIYKGYWYYLDPNRKSDVDNVFYVTLRDYTCPAYTGTWFGQKRSTICKRWAWTYRQAVRPGNPKNGADAT